MVEEQLNSLPDMVMAEVEGEVEGGTESVRLKIKGLSLMEFLTPEEVRNHVSGLKQPVCHDQRKEEEMEACACQLCGLDELTYQMPPLFCSPCRARIEPNAAFYSGRDTRPGFLLCEPCYDGEMSDTIEVEGIVFAKAELVKKWNNGEAEEWWVQCDKCEAWQHQICALFNARRNDAVKAEYTCRNCYIDEVERGEREPLPQSEVLGAKDLPRTLLSDHIENRLFERLTQERIDRANHHGKSVDEVPGVEGLVVRVVSSVDKKLEVNPRILEMFRRENYPTEFPYRSKAVLLFQKIEGAEVCLFSMYVQEFGAEAAFPNKRCVYISYLDSVKYFRPEIQTVTGEFLRTFVYHEILVGYLEYCKMRGFTSCYIWACPPPNGEDDIFYCHPEFQKVPKSVQIREWYLRMIRKAIRENVVVDSTNLYDGFFTNIGESRAKVTASRLPYFDGDYWPGEAEGIIHQLRQGLSENASTDAMLMQKMGETIHPMKEDLIMVHLQHPCAHCCMIMVEGTRWTCNTCQNYNLCEKCYDGEQKREDRERHPTNSREKHTFKPVAVTDIPKDTKDKDEVIESEFFDERRSFLSLCQGNHYQFETLRRAKHSSMMVLYHLHNPTDPAFVTDCNVCCKEIETDQEWKCEVCDDFNVCDGCYHQEGAVDHMHVLVKASNADRDAQNMEARQMRIARLREMLDLLVHASQCRLPQCQYPNCRKVKGLFRHGIRCETRASGGCLLCKKMWYILQLHARACRVTECSVPRCKDLKEHFLKLKQQSESRRRAAVNEMVRQRGAEASGINDQ